MIWSCQLLFSFSTLSIPRTVQWDKVKSKVPFSIRCHSFKLMCHQLHFLQLTNGSSVNFPLWVREICSSRVQLFATPWTVVLQASLSMESSRQECWNGLPFPSPGDLPDPRIEPGSPALQADSLSSESLGKPQFSSLSDTEVSKTFIRCDHM